MQVLTDEAKEKSQVRLQTQNAFLLDGEKRSEKVIHKCGQSNNSRERNEVESFNVMYANINSFVLALTGENDYTKAKCSYNGDRVETKLSDQSVIPMNAED